MLEIEFEKPIEEICECCGNTTVKLTRFIYKNDDAFGIYYAKFTKNHPEKNVIGLISLRDWGTDLITSRVSFLFNLWLNDKDYNIEILDAQKNSPWKSEILGKLLSRSEALNHKWITEVYHITDHIVLEDKILIQHLNNF